MEFSVGAFRVLVSRIVDKRLFHFQLGILLREKDHVLGLRLHVSLLRLILSIAIYLVSGCRQILNNFFQGLDILRRLNYFHHGVHLLLVSSHHGVHLFGELIILDVAKGGLSLKSGLEIGQSLTLALDALREGL